MTDVDHPEDDQARNEAERDESPLQRLDRNWDELLQELRVLQTGVQLLTGFLLTLPFQQRFVDLDDDQRSLYLVVIALALASTAFLVAPVAMHRLLFRQRSRRPMVAVAHRFALVGLALFGLALVGVILLIVDVVLSRGPAVVAATVTLVAILALWVATPLAIRRLPDDRRPD